MRTALKVLLGLMLMCAVSGCCCCGGGYDTYWTAPDDAPVVGTLTPPEVTIR